MENQVTTIEQSQRLMALGVPAEKASLIWVKHGEIWDLHISECLRCDLNRNEIENYPAFTMADLLPIIPFIIINPVNGKEYCITIKYDGVKWKLNYDSFTDSERIGSAADFEFFALLCDRIEWLMSSGYNLNYEQADAGSAKQV